MNKILSRIVLCCSIVFSFGNIFAQNPTYSLKATNFVRTPDSLTFDIMLLHTNTGTAEYKYALGQYFLNLIRLSQTAEH